MLIYLQMIETEEDKTKFMRLYERYGGYLFTAAYQILGSGSDAEDAVHQTFLAVIKHLGQIKAVDTPEAQKYLLVIVERKAVDMLRCILRHTAAVGAVVQRPLCGLRSGRN